VWHISSRSRSVRAMLIISSCSCDTHPSRGPHRRHTICQIGRLMSLRSPSLRGPEGCCALVAYARANFLMNSSSVVKSPCKPV
jgi:hypothetical protein